jgi:hypothetical protein
VYDGDSFFTLSQGGQAGLLAVSAGLSILMVWVMRRAARGRRWPVRVLVWAGAFTAFLWLSPQVYYLYYRTIIDGLPLQWVIGPWPDPVRAVAVLAFAAKPSLADHGAALLGWLMLLSALTANLDRPRPADPPRRG